MWSGYTGAGGKTVIPDSAHAKLSARLVPGQDPAHVTAALTAHLKAQAGPLVTLEVRAARDGTKATEVAPDHPLLRAAEAALAQSTGVAPIRVRMGATLPLTDICARVLGLDTVMFSFATADEDFHAPNECWRGTSIGEGFRAWVALLRNLSPLTRQDFAAARR